jgi:pimeloyl-ACP methyl ester carboxylesterase
MLPLLCLPGIEGNRHIWDPTIALISARECRSKNLPGEGSDLHEIARLVLDEVIWPRFWVAGLSLGGLVGRAMAEVAPERIEGLVMIGCLPSRELLPKVVQLSPRALGLLPASILRRAYARRILRRMMTEGIPVVDAKALCADLPDKASYIRRLKAVEKWGLSSEIDPPALLLRGASEREAPWSLEQAQEELVGVQVETIGGSHRAPWTHPEEMARRIGLFIEGR